mgnify:CR=1 FL=1
MRSGTGLCSRVCDPADPKAERNQYISPKGLRIFRLELGYENADRLCRECPMPIKSQPYQNKQELDPYRNQLH